MQNNGITQQLWSLLKSLKLTTTLIVLMIITSMTGTFIAQRSQTRVPIEELYSPLIIRVFNFFDLFDLYHSWWFITILLLFFINLLVCTLDRAPKIFHAFARPFPLIPLEQLKASPLYASLPFNNPDSLIALIKRKYPHFSPASISQEEARFYLGKGRYGHFNFLIVHAGLLLLMIGAMVGGIFGFDGQLMLQEGQTTSTLSLEDDRGQSSIIPLGFAIKCRAFRIEYYDQDGRPKQYYSDLEIMEKGRLVRQETISVNHPLQYKKLNFYQSSYGSDPTLTFTLKSEEPTGQAPGPLSAAFRFFHPEKASVAQIFVHVLRDVQYIS